MTDHYYVAKICMEFEIGRDAPNKKEFLAMLKEDFQEDYNMELEDKEIVKITRD